MIRLVLWLIGPFLKDTARMLTEEFERNRAELAQLRKDVKVLQEGLERMVRARELLPHAGAAPPRLPGETVDAYARRLLPKEDWHPEPTGKKDGVVNRTGPSEEPPEDFV